MTLREATEGQEYIIREIVTDDEELNAFLFSLGCYTGEAITVIAHRKGVCTVSELMGYERNVYMDYNGTRIISKVPVEIEVKVDDHIELAIDTAKMHLFDKETENVIDQ